MTGRTRILAATTALILSAAALAVAVGTAKGTATYTSKKGPVTVTFTHAALVAGPDVVSGKLMRRLVLSTRDVSAAIKACESMMSCSDGGIEEGMTVDFSGEPRLGFWFVANGQLIQHSGVIRPEVATLSTDRPDHLAGTLSFDQTASGGPSVAVTFDASLVKTLKK
jgi:hypothetical protein